MFKVTRERRRDAAQGAVIEFEAESTAWQTAPQHYKMTANGDGWVNVYHGDPLGGWHQVGLYRLHDDGVAAINKQFSLVFARYLYVLTRRLRELAKD